MVWHESSWLALELQHNGRRLRHETVSFRCPLGTAHAFDSRCTQASLSLSRAQAIGPPQDTHGHFVRAQDRYRLGRPPQRSGLRLRQDLSSLPPRVHKAGVWLKLHAVLLAELNGADKIDWQRALIDASFAKAPEGGEDTGPNPTDRGKCGSKHHVMTDAQGIPLSATTTAANVNEVTQILPVLLDMPPVGGKPGPKRQLPDRLQGDRGYDSEPVRTLLRWLGITPMLAARNTEHGSGLGVYRWFVERTISWLHSFGRLRRRLDRRTDIQEAFLELGCSLICLRFLMT